MLIVIKTAKELQKILNEFKNPNSSIGFVPTMGSLHEGHLRLMRKAKRENSVVIVSIFVNPTQFNDKRDLEKYPRDLERDLELILPTGINIVYAPSEEDIYPGGPSDVTNMDLGGLDRIMEGQFRPGHFQGVAQVVKRLLEIVTPNKLYMGQKDFQQMTIIRYMLKRWKMTTTLIECPTIREPHGLAMSSRNVRLSQEGREFAAIIYKTLKAVKCRKKTDNPEDIKKYALKRLSTSPLRVEYFDIVDSNTLKSLRDWDDSIKAVACTAVWLEGVRLIDNIYF